MIYINNNYIDKYITYKNLKQSIYRYKFKIKDLENELEFIIKMSGPGKVQAQNYELKTGSYKAENVNDLYEEIKKLSLQINELKSELDILTQKKLRAEWVIENDLNSIEKKVLYLREIEELSLWEIALEVDRSYNWVRHLSSRIDKKIEKVIKSKKVAITTQNNTIKRN